MNRIRMIQTFVLSFVLFLLPGLTLAQSNISWAVDSDGAWNVGSNWSGDISSLGASYGLSDGDGGYNNEADVGPTDTKQGLGIPETDNEVGFEDLMVFGYNYGTVNPAPILTVDNCTAQLNWELQDENRWSLQLTQECESLQGLHLQAELPDGVTVQVMPGNLLGNQTSPVFLKNANDQILDIGLAVLGHNKSFNGVGELLIVTLSETVEVLFPEIEARDMTFLLRSECACWSTPLMVVWCVVW